MNLEYFNNYIEYSDPIQLIKNPKFSIIIITYNHEKWIYDAVISVIRQKEGSEIEIIIGNDCSTDKTLAICLRLQKKYPGSIRIISSLKNTGPQINVWRCANLCKGDYLAFCEGDDYWEENRKLSEQLFKLKKLNLKFSVAYWNTVLYNKKITNTAFISENKQMNMGNFRFFHISTWLIEKKLFLTASSSKCAMHLTDMSLLTYFIIEHDIFVFPSIVSNYRLTGQGQWSSKNEETKTELELSRVWERYNYYPKKYRWFFAIQLIKIYYSLLKRIYFKKNFIWIKMAIKNERNLILLMRVTSNILMLIFNNPLVLFKILRSHINSK